jgi:hypothetical protein
MEKIVAKPDSVPVSININDSLKAELIISGKLDSNYFQPKTVKVVFSNGIKQQLQVKGNVMTWE